MEFSSWEKYLVDDGFSSKPRWITPEGLPIPIYSLGNQHKYGGFRFVMGYHQRAVYMSRLSCTNPCPLYKVYISFNPAPSHHPFIDGFSMKQTIQRTWGWKIQRGTAAECRNFPGRDATWQLATSFRKKIMGIS